MRELTDTIKRTRTKLKDFERMTEELRSIETIYRKAKPHTQDQDISVSTTPGLSEARVSAHFYSNHLTEELLDVFDRDVWDSSTIYQNGGHAESQQGYEYHIVAKRDVCEH